MLQETVFAISAMNLLSGSLHFVTALVSAMPVLNLFLRIILKQIFKRREE